METVLLAASVIVNLALLMVISILWADLRDERRLREALTRAQETSDYYQDLYMEMAKRYTPDSVASTNMGTTSTNTGDPRKTEYMRGGNDGD